MRRINPSRFKVATRGTSRDINSRIVLNLVRAHQPISRADLARTMGVSRAAVSLIVNDLLREGLIFEGATGENGRGRKPTFLYIDSRRRAVVATRAGGIPEAVVDNETGLLVAPHDEAGLAAAIVRVLKEPALRARLGAAGRARVADEFGVDKLVARTLAVYERRLLNPTRPT
jgi:glycosyltransferase involved in cell wall biosynthesis